MPVEPSQPRITPQPVAVRLPSSKSTVTYTILGVTIAIYLIQMATAYFMGLDLPFALGGKINSYVDKGQLWRFITPIFLHSNIIVSGRIVPTAILHIGFNMYALSILGPQLERFYGHWKFLALYLVSGFSGVVFSYVLTPQASLGASTAIFGLIAALGIFAYQNQKVFGQGARRVMQNMIQIALINFILGLTPGIDNWGHLGGFIGGALVAWFGGPIYKISGISPDLTLKNQRSESDFILYAVGTFLLASILGIGILLFK